MSETLIAKLRARGSAEPCNGAGGGQLLIEAANVIETAERERKRWVDICAENAEIHLAQLNAEREKLAAMTEAATAHLWSAVKLRKQVGTLRDMASAHASQARSNRAWPSVAEEHEGMYSACLAGADALARQCASCAHYDANSAATEGVGYCTNPVGWHRAKAMPPHEMCTKWEKADAN